MIKSAQYWREFTADTKAEAQKEAESWWSEQSGFDKVSGWVIPVADTPPGGIQRWAATIIYRSSADRPTIH